MDSKNFLGKRRDRVIAILLSYKEREIDRYLPEQVASKFRREILDQINDLCDLAFDLLATDTVFNEEFLQRLDEIYECVTADK